MAADTSSARMDTCLPKGMTFQQRPNGMPNRKPVLVVSLMSRDPVAKIPIRVQRITNSKNFNTLKRAKIASTELLAEMKSNPGKFKDEKNKYCRNRVTKGNKEKVHNQYYVMTN